MNRFLSTIPFSWIVLGINIGSNLAGFFLVQVLLGNAYPQEEWHRMAALDSGTNLALLAVLVPAAMVVLLVLAAPVNSAFKALKRGKELSETALKNARRRAINIPFYAAFMNLAAWVIPSVAFPVFFKLRSPDSSFNLGVAIIYNFSNAVMITLLALVLLEQACRVAVIPKLFPEGRVKDEGKTFRLTIRHKLLIMYFAICFIPMFQTALMINANAWYADPNVVLPHLGAFSVILFMFAALYGLWLVLLFSRNISAPAREIMKAAETISAGDYDARVQVTSNDEIGHLGDRVNEMAKELKERERIREVFNLFTSPEISREVLSRKSFTGGEIRQVTLLFSDLRNFTTMAERFSPEKVLDSINNYFEEMSAAVVQHGGIVLQYVGDEVEAVFGAPLDDPAHADKAVAAALEMRARLAALNHRRLEQGQDPLNHGIGIHTGPALAGIVGSRYKISYALVGDTVNLASRIQGLTKELDADILISKDTRDSLTLSRTLSAPFNAQVKGKQKSVQIFRLID
jgi:class 3 adenylate cyclase